MQQYPSTTFSKESARKRSCNDHPGPWRGPLQELVDRSGHTVNLDFKWIPKGSLCWGLGSVWGSVCVDCLRKPTQSSAAAFLVRLPRNILLRVFPESDQKKEQEALNLISKHGYIKRCTSGHKLTLTAPIFKHH